jgi:iron complex outermembrane recepter protein
MPSCAASARRAAQGTAMVGVTSHAVAAARPGAGRWRSIAGLVVALLIAHPPSGRAQSLQQLSSMSIEQLSRIQVTSVAKVAEPLNDAPAAIYVITHDQIMASGFTTIPDILRLAPNLQVAQINSYSWAISARGFNVGDNASLSNKLLVMVDGRSVYSPMFGGVYWDMLDVLPENIERIEVISGPGATLWGANAVNGVINIITRPSSDTQGGVLTLGAGNFARDVSLQYGGRLSPDLTYRVHGEFSETNSYNTSGGGSANDAWSQPGGGFRLDWTPRNDTVTVQGDLATETESSEGFNRESDAVASWHHRFEDGSSMQLLAYFDSSTRSVNDGSSFTVDTYDIEFQHNFKIAGWNHIVWGAGERNFNYVFENTSLALEPPDQRLNLANVFGQDTISLSDTLKLTLGLKLEDEPYAGLQVMPSGRLAWKVTNTVLLWGAISRAVRSPTPVDANLREYAGPIDVLNGSTEFRPETLTAYELGTRVQISPRASFSLSGYYDVYDDLRSIEAASDTSLFPITFGNLMAGTVYGFELWGDYQVTDWWRLTAGVSALHEDLHFLAGSLDLLGLAFVADDPGHQASIQSLMTLGHGVTLFTDLREVGSLPHPVVPGYVELDARIGWDITQRLQLSLSGYNLLHAEHVEFVEPGESTEVPRSFFVQARLRF